MQIIELSFQNELNQSLQVGDEVFYSSTTTEGNFSTSELSNVIRLGEVTTVAANALTFKTDGSKVYHANGEVLFTNAGSFADWQVQNGAGAGGDLANNDELFNLNPITVILQFER